MLLAACTCSAPELPWWVAWIPVIAAFVGLAGGVLGVWIGAAVTARNDLRRWRLEQRNQALLEFARRADVYQQTLTRYMAPAVAAAAGAQSPTAGDVLEAMYGLDGAGTLVQMMSPQPLRQRVSDLMTYMVTDIMPFTLPGMAIPAAAQATPMLQGFITRFAAFVEIARADFGEA